MAKPPNKIIPGYRARNPQTGETIVYTGDPSRGNGGWEPVKSPAEAEFGFPVQPGRQLSPNDEKQLDELKLAAQTAPDIERLYSRAEPAIDRFGTGPTRGMIYDVLTAQQGGGIFDKIGGAVGGLAEGIGVLPSESRRDFDLITQAQAERVLEEQLKQKGVQSEGDALRMMLADIGPYKTPETNKALISNARVKLARAPMRARFYQAWAQTFGLRGLDSQGRTVEDAFEEYAKRQGRTGAPAAEGPREGSIRKLD